MIPKRTYSVLADRKRIRTFQARLLRWYTLRARKFPWRRRRATKFQRIIAEVLLQRTRAAAVAAFLPRFLVTYPSWDKIAAARTETLGKFLQPLGLWRRRGASLKALAVEMVSRGGRFPKTRQEIEVLPGVGQYIANAIMLFCHDAAEPLLDVNMARVLERHFGPRKLVDIRYDPHLQALSRQVLNGTDAMRMNWAILDIAALVCTIQNPRCDQCPLSSTCLYGRQRLEFEMKPVTATPARFSQQLTVQDR
jgi:A/G-specific adenine glycosylase